MGLLVERRLSSLEWDALEGESPVQVVAEPL